MLIECWGGGTFHRRTCTNSRIYECDTFLGKSSAGVIRVHLWFRETILEHLDAPSVIAVVFLSEHGAPEPE